MKHTPGPWEYCKDRDANGYRRIYSPGRAYTIAIPQSVEEDARLIAAAPDLLEAAVGLVALIEAGISTKVLCEIKDGGLYKLKASIAAATKPAP